LQLDGRNPDMADSNKDSYFVGPTIFTDITLDMSVSKEEIFGPVLSIHKLGCIDRPLDAIRDHPMGNGAVILTQNSFYTERFIQKADVGMVGVNVGIRSLHPYLPFGGIKGSLIGNNMVQGKDAVDFIYSKQSSDRKSSRPRCWNSQ
jgi:malonate-semialdehyde dehydrogenase (acetylating)/methylmalonate-semialdehyde dehydrogenase